MQESPPKTVSQTTLDNLCSVTPCTVGPRHATLSASEHDALSVPSVDLRRHSLGGWAPGPQSTPRRFPGPSTIARAARHTPSWRSRHEPFTKPAL